MLRVSGLWGKEHLQSSPLHSKIQKIFLFFFFRNGVLWGKKYDIPQFTGHILPTTSKEQTKWIMNLILGALAWKTFLNIFPEERVAASRHVTQDNEST